MGGIFNDYSKFFGKVYVVSCFIKHHVLKAFGGVDVLLHAFLA
jgi:hypothetical protein